MNKNKIQANEEEEEEADDNQQQVMSPSKLKSKRKKRNWLELPYDVTANILLRIGAIDILENAQKVCTLWRKICKDPAMWRVISLDTRGDPPRTRPALREMCKHAVDRSQGQLLDLTIIDFADDELLKYVAERSSQLKRLEIVGWFDRICGAWGDVLKKFPFLEELSLHGRVISEEGIEAAGRYCPLLKTLRLNRNPYRLNKSDDESITRQNAMAIAIGKYLAALRHLELIGNRVSNTGLKAILDGCCHLETLDLCRCFNVDLRGHMGKEYEERIKNLKLPYDSLEDCLHIFRIFSSDSDNS